jgi:hypothetical protein
MPRDKSHRGKTHPTSCRRLAQRKRAEAATPKIAAPLRAMAPQEDIDRLTAALMIDP